MAVVLKRKSGNPGNSNAQPLPNPYIHLANMEEGIKTSKDKAKANHLPIESYNGKTEGQLLEFIEPAPEKADRATHRLDREQLDARLVLMHRMLIRKVSPEEIRGALKISVPMYYKIKNELNNRMRLDVSKVDVPYLIGDSLSLYDEVRSMALTISSSSAIKDPKVKLSAMAVVLKAEQDKNSFLSNCGVYSSSVVEHIIRGIISTGNFTVIDGKAERMIDAQEVNQELFIRLRQYAKDRAAITNSDILGDSSAINCTEEDKCVH
jgi:hypothetical protein